MGEVEKQALAAANLIIGQQADEMFKLQKERDECLARATVLEKRIFLMEDGLARQREIDNLKAELRLAEKKLVSALEQHRDSIKEAAKIMGNQERFIIERNETIEELKGMIKEMIEERRETKL